MIFLIHRLPDFTNLETFENWLMKFIHNKQNFSLHCQLHHYFNHLSQNNAGEKMHFLV